MALLTKVELRMHETMNFENITPLECLSLLPISTEACHNFTYTIEWQDFVNRKIGTKSSRAANNLLVNRVSAYWKKIINSIYDTDANPIVIFVDLDPADTFNETM